MSLELTQGDFGHTILFKLVDDELAKLCKPSCVDLSDVDIRALFYKVTEEVPGSCNTTQIVPTANAIFYRLLPKLEFNLLTTTANVGGPNEYVPEIQPECAQRLSIEISGLTVAGDIVITGTDIDGNPLSETIPVTVDGILFTMGSYLTVDLETFVVTGDFSVRIYVHDGKVQLTWQEGDLAEPGRHVIVLEQHPLLGGKVTQIGMVDVFIVEKKTLPIPLITAVMTSPALPGASLSLIGTGFLEALTLELVSLDTAVIYTADNFSVVGETNITADVPTTIPGGLYQLRVVGPGGTSPFFGPFTILPIITSFSPLSVMDNDTLNIQGQGFTGVTSVEVESISSGSIYTLSALNFISDTEVEADMTAAPPAGTYKIRVIVPTGPSNSAKTLTVT